MHFDKAMLADDVLQDDSFSETEFFGLLERLELLPEAERGRQALLISSLLAEFAAFDLAGSISSDAVGELIEAAARMADLGDGLALEQGVQVGLRRALQ